MDRECVWNQSSKRTDTGMISELVKLCSSSLLKHKYPYVSETVIPIPSVLRRELASLSNLVMKRHTTTYQYGFNSNSFNRITLDEDEQRTGNRGLSSQANYS